jgi:hypothetical protein
VGRAIRGCAGLARAALQTWVSPHLLAGDMMDDLTPTPLFRLIQRQLRVALDWNHNLSSVFGQLMGKCALDHDLILDIVDLCLAEEPHRGRPRLRRSQTAILCPCPRRTSTSSSSSRS